MLKSIIILFLFFNPCGYLLAQEKILFKGEVNTDNINIRTDATVSSKKICNVNKGQVVEIVLELYDWYKIKLPKNAAVFIKKNLVSPINNRTIKVLKNNVNIRAHPDESSAILGSADKDELINVLEDKGDWYRIEAPHNTFGWIHKKFIKRKEPVS